MITSLAQELACLVDGSSTVNGSIVVTFSGVSMRTPRATLRVTRSSAKACCRATRSVEWTHCTMRGLMPEARRSSTMIRTSRTLRWVGLSYDGPIISGWSALAQTEEEVVALMDKLRNDEKASAS
jgi:hypothetical protein